MKPGTRLKSAACDTELVVIRAGDGRIECGGSPMAESKSEPVALQPGHTGGTLMGKRYVDADDAYELLCVKPGIGSLSVDGVALVVKVVKPLPSSD